MSKNSYGHVGCKDATWNKAPTVRGKDPDLYRRDPYGNVLYKPSYGKDTAMGWHIDHIKPQSKNGSDSLRNLQVMQSSKNKSLGDTTTKRKHR